MSRVSSRRNKSGAERHAALLSGKARGRSQHLRDTGHDKTLSKAQLRWLTQLSERSLLALRAGHHARLLESDTEPLMATECLVRFLLRKADDAHDPPLSRDANEPLETSWPQTASRIKPCCDTCVPPPSTRLDSIERLRESETRSLARRVCAFLEDCEDAFSSIVACANIALGSPRRAPRPKTPS